MSTAIPNYTLTISNKKIWTFYKEHPNIKFEDMCVIFHEFVERFANDLSSSLHTTVNQQILSSVTEQYSNLNNVKTNIDNVKTNIDDLKGYIMTISNNVQQIINDLNRVNNDMSIKLVEFKKEYNESIYSVSNKSNETIIATIEKNNILLFEKINNLISTIPENIQPRIKTINSEFQENIIKDTHQLFSVIQRDIPKTLSITTGEVLQNYMNSFEIKNTNLLQNVQSQIINQISQFRESNNLHRQRQDIIFNDLSIFLNKYRTSAHKGNLEQNHLESILMSLFPSAEVLSTAKQTASCDIRLIRNNRPSILFENKDYESTVNRHEVDKFIRDIDLNQDHGIFLSQSSGITSKENFQIDVNDGKILLYIHNVKYSKDLIRIAVEIIDGLHSRLEKIYAAENNIDNENDTHHESIVIENENIIKIYNEFISLQKNKRELIDMLNTNHKKAIDFIDLSFSMPVLNNILDSKFPKKSNDFDGRDYFFCDICNDFKTLTKRSLAAHKKGCARHHNVINAK